MDLLTAGVSSQEDIQAAQRHQQEGNTQLAIQSYESVNIEEKSFPRIQTQSTSSFVDIRGLPFKSFTVVALLCAIGRMSTRLLSLL